MTVTTTHVENNYVGNGSQTTFPITFQFLSSAQIKVKLNDLIQVSGYSVSGTNVIFSTAPASGDTVMVYRSTTITQETDYIDNANFPAEAHERALDRLTMIMQEVAAMGSTASTGGGSFVVLDDQAFAAGGTITISSDGFMLAPVQGSGGATTLDQVLPIAEGVTDGQLLILMGLDDDNPLEIVDAGNVHLNGDVTLGMFDTVQLVWRATPSMWIEIARSV